MRHFAAFLVLIFSISVFAQEPALVPPKKKEEKKEEKKDVKKKEKKEDKSDYQELYEKLREKYQKKEEEKKAPQPEKKETPKPVEPAKPQPESVKPEPKPVEPQPEPVKPEPKPEVKVKPTVNVMPIIDKEKLKITPLAPAKFRKLDMEITAFSSLSNGIGFFGSDLKNSSYAFALDSALIDMKMNVDQYAKARMILDFANVVPGTRTVVENNYDHDPDSPDSSHEIVKDTPEAFIDVVEEASLTFDNLPYFLMAKAGKFRLPFGIENEMHRFELPFYYRSRVGVEYLGGGFNDLGLQIGVNYPLMQDNNIKISYTLFNGKNSTHLDGNDDFQAPAHNFDLRYVNNGNVFSSIVSLSAIYGSAFHEYKELSGGILENTAGQKLNAGVGSPVIDEERFKTEKKNLLVAAGADLKYAVNNDLKVGLSAEFHWSRREVYNPIQIDKDGNEASGDDGKPKYLLQDGLSYYPDKDYTSVGFFVAPNVSYGFIDAMVRFSLHEQPYLYRYLLDGDNSFMGVDFMTNINISENVAFGVNYRYLSETLNRFKPEIDANNYTEETFNHTELMFSLSFSMDAIAPLDK